MDRNLSDVEKGEKLCFSPGVGSEDPVEVEVVKVHKTYFTAMVPNLLGTGVFERHFYKTDGREKGSKALLGAPRCFRRTALDLKVSQAKVRVVLNSLMHKSATLTQEQAEKLLERLLVLEREFTKAGG